MRLRSSSSSAPKAATSSRESGRLRDDVIEITSIKREHQRSRVTSDTGTEMHRRMSSSGSAVIAPLSRFFTAPLCLRQVQLWQMPMRHPLRGLSPAVSACTSKGTPVSPRTSVNERAKRRTISWVSVAATTAGVKAAARGLRIAAVLPEGVDGIEQAARAAHQRATFGRVRHDAVEVLARETPRQFARERRGGGDAEVEVQVRMALPEPYQLVGEDQVAMGVCVVGEHDVRVDPVDEQVAQHGHE